MMRGVLGIDLGCSSVKIIYNNSIGEAVKVTKNYNGVGCESWYNSVTEALLQLDLSEAKAIGLSSHVGSYIINGSEVIDSNESVGKSELDEINARFSQDDFISEISTPHPDNVSCSLERLLYIKRTYPHAKSVCQPKDLLCEKLTGNLVTDKYSYKGLVNIKTNKCNNELLKLFEIDESVLPKILDITAIAGTVTEHAATDTGLPKGIPVFVGCNEFYASLLGAGIYNDSELFDIAQGNEHIGIISPELKVETSLECDEYFNGYINYSVTDSSESSFEFGLRQFSNDNIYIGKCLANNPPIFLPYLNGLSSPICDMDAKGVFFGINSNCTNEDMAYSVFEGIAFKLYNIYQLLGAGTIKVIKIAGSTSKDKTLNKIKAELFGIPVLSVKETDTAALGAQMIAAIGMGIFKDIPQAITTCCKRGDMIIPNSSFKSQMLKRFEIYKSLYPSLKENFKNFNNISL